MVGYNGTPKYGLDVVAKAAYQGDVDTLEMLLTTGDAENKFKGDINTHVTDMTPLMFAAHQGHAEAIKVLLDAKADPWMKARAPHGKDPSDAQNAKDVAKKMGWDDCVKMLEAACKSTEPGKYMRYGKLNNSRLEVYTAGTSDGAKDPLKEMKIEGYVPGMKAALMETRTTCGLLFPGQGSQYVKMMSTVIDLPKVQNMVAEATSILGFDIRKLVLEGPEEELEKTSKCQPAMFLAGMAGLEKLRQERPDAIERPGAVAGLSLGEYTALCVAGVFTFEQGMKLVQIRGEAMDAAANSGAPQAMLSVAGLEQDQIEKLCKEAAGSSETCGIANILFPKGFSCSGSAKAINILKDKAEKAGAMQAKLLKTSGAFHTELMKPAQLKLDKALKDLLPSMKPPMCDVYMNYTGKKVKAGTAPKDFIDNLSFQLCSPVLWEPSVRLMIKDGLSEFYEVGPMKQLKAMMKRIDPNMWNSTMNVEV